jgi:hypothetical protein
MRQIATHRLRSQRPKVPILPSSCRPMAPIPQRSCRHHDEASHAHHRCHSDTTCDNNHHAPKLCTSSSCRPKTPTLPSPCRLKHLFRRIVTEGPPNITASQPMHTAMVIRTQTATSHHTPTSCTAGIMPARGTHTAVLPRRLPPTSRRVRPCRPPWSCGRTQTATSHRTPTTCTAGIMPARGTHTAELSQRLPPTSR